MSHTGGQPHEVDPVVEGQSLRLRDIRQEDRQEDRTASSGVREHRNEMDRAVGGEHTPP